MPKYCFIGLRENLKYKLILQNFSRTLINGEKVIWLIIILQMKILSTVLEDKCKWELIAICIWFFDVHVNKTQVF